MAYADFEFPHDSLQFPLPRYTPHIPLPTCTFFEGTEGMWGNSDQRTLTTLASKDPETSTECARPSRSTSLTRSFCYWLYVCLFFRLSIWTKTVARIQSWNLIFSRNKISLLFFICRLFRTDFTGKFEGTDLLHGAAKNHNFTPLFSSIKFWQTDTEYFVLEGRKLFDDIHVSIWGFQNRVCLSVRTPRKEITLASSISVLH